MGLYLLYTKIGAYGPCRGGVRRQGSGSLKPEEKLDLDEHEKAGATCLILLQLHIHMLKIS